MGVTTVVTTTMSTTAAKTSLREYFGFDTDAGYDQPDFAPGHHAEADDDCFFGSCGA